MLANEYNQRLVAHGKRRTILLLFGLCAGLSIGLAIQELKRRIGLELATMLDDEARKSVGCSFSYESFSISFLTQRLVAENGLIRCPDRSEPVLHFDQVVADFSLRHIRSKIIDLDIRLTAGNTNGFFDDSATYRFIDSLATPPSPERQAADRYKIRLQKLRVDELAGNDWIGIFDLAFSGASLALARDKNDEFDLTATIPTGTVTVRPFPHLVAPAENLYANLHLTDKVVSINSITGALDRSIFLNAHLDIENKAGGFLRGKIKAAGKLAQTELLNHHQVGGSLASQIDISGTSKAPLFESTTQINNPSYRELKGDVPLVVQTTYLAGPKRELQFPSVTGSFPRFQVTTASPLGLTNQAVRGAIRILPREPFAGYVEVRPEGNLEAVGASFSANINSAQGVSINGVGAIDRILGGAPNFEASSKLIIPSFPEIDMKLERVENGVARAALTGAQESIKGAGELSLETFAGEAQLALSSKAVAQLLDCGSLEGSLKYRWSDLDSLALGSGQLGINQFGFGCGVGAVTMPQEFNGIIEGGALKLNNLELSSLGKPFRIGGSVSINNGFDLTASGSLDLAAANALITRVDDISGIAAGNIAIKGPLASPSMSGSLSLSELRLEQASSGIGIEHGAGEIVLADTTLELKDVNAQFNDGNVTLGGFIDLADISRSEITAQASQITVEPTERLILTTSGSITLRQLPSGVAVASGNIVINNGEFVDSFTTSQLIRSIQRLIVRQRSTQAQLMDSAPEIQLDVTVAAERGLFISTNLGSAELASDLRVSGTLRNPVIEGALSTRSGWIGYANRRFEISAAQITFSPSSSEPILELTAETILPARSGENVLILMTARGPVTSPTISFSSDQPLSGRELLNLVTSGGSFQSRTRANTIGVNTLHEEPRGVLEELARLNLRAFFSQLVNVDSLSISPIFNPRTGLVEPALVAEKLLANKLSLVGETTFSGVEGIARARMQYDLSDSFALGALIEEDPSRTSLPTELQVTYTPLSRQAQRVKVTFTGNKALSEQEILKGLKISSISFVTPRDILSLERTLIEIYERGGYPNTSVKIGCREFNETCEEIEISISEGAPRFVQSIALVPDSLPPELSSAKIKKAILAVDRNQLANDQFKTGRIAALTRALRAEGYVAARVEGNYTCDASNQCLLEINATPEAPISFVFTGNKLFSAQDFLNAIRLFERTQPFGNNTPTVLANTMERMYRTAGHLFATVSFTQDLPTAENSSRTTFRFLIDEGPHVSIKEVQIEGTLSDEMRAALRGKLEAIGAWGEIMDQSIAIAEEVETNASTISDALQQLGYHDNEVTGRILPDADNPEATIVYHVETKTEARRVPLVVSGLPGKVSVPPQLQETSIFDFQVAERAKEYEQLLHEEGFPRATVAASDADSGQLSVQSGPEQIVGEISVKGARSISSQVVIQGAELSIGERASRTRLDEVRRRLLMLGLFARVTVSTEAIAESADAKQPTRVIIDVIERAPQNAEIGAGYNSEFGFHLFGEGADRSLFGDGRQLAARLDGYYDPSENTISKGTASVQFRAPFFMGSELGLSEDLRFQRFDLATLPYDLDRVSLASYLSGQEDAWTYSFGHTLQGENLDNVSPDAVLSPLDTGTLRIGFLSGTIAYDERDAPLNPQSGFLLALDAKLAWSAFGSNANFSELAPRFSWALPVSTRWGFAYQLRGGWQHSFDSNEQIPITERFFLGGRTSVRGFKENSLGTHGYLDSAIGGTYFANQNVELRYRPLDAVSLAWFVDSGSVTFDRPTVGDLRHSTGLGIRYISPIGPIGFDVGFPLERQSDEDSYRVHFTIGTIF